MTRRHRLAAAAGLALIFAGAGACALREGECLSGLCGWWCYIWKCKCQCHHPLGLQDGQCMEGHYAYAR